MALIALIPLNERDAKFWLQLDAPYKRELVGASGLLLQWVVT